MGETYKYLTLAVKILVITFVWTILLLSISKVQAQEISVNIKNPTLKEVRKALWHDGVAPTNFTHPSLSILEEKSLVEHSINSLPEELIRPMSQFNL